MNHRGWAFLSLLVFIVGVCTALFVWAVMKPSALWALLAFNVGVWGTFLVCMWRDCHDGPWWFEEWFGQW